MIKPHQYTTALYFLALLLFGVAVATIDDYKWLILLAAVLVLFPACFILRKSSDLWLFLFGMLSSLRVVKYLAEPSAKYYVSDQFAINPVDVPLFFLAIPIVYRVAVERSLGMQALPRHLQKAVIAGFLFCFWCMVAAPFAKVPRLAVLESINYARLFLVFFVIVFSVDNRRSLVACLAGCFAALIAQDVLAVLQYLLKSSFNLYEHYYDETSVGTVIRSGGTLNPTVLSEYLGVLAPLVYCLLFSVRRRKNLLIFFGIFGLSTLATILTFSRGGALSLACSVLYISLKVANRDPSKKKIVYLLIAALLVSLSLAAYQLYDVLLVRADIARNDVLDEAGRLFQYRHAVEMISDHPLGVGLGNYMENLYGYASWIPFPVHNKFLLIAAEAGIAGLGLYLFFWFSLFRQLKTAWQTEDLVLERFVIIGVMGAMIGTLINMQTDIYALGGAPELSLFIVAGLGAATLKESYA